MAPGSPALTHQSRECLAAGSGHGVHFSMLRHLCCVTVGETLNPALCSPFVKREINVYVKLLWEVSELTRGAYLEHSLAPPKYYLPPACLPPFPPPLQACHSLHLPLTNFSIPQTHIQRDVESTGQRRAFQLGGEGCMSWLWAWCTRYRLNLPLPETAGESPGCIKGLCSNITPIGRS